MDLRLLTDWVDRQEWLDTAADVVQPGVKGFFGLLGSARAAIKDFLHGTWLGHPLHPVLTDVPLGAWTVTLLLDALESRAGAQSAGLRRAADASVALGLAGAVGSAVTGLTDWSETDARPRRLGMAHAALNSGATLLFGASLWARFGANRRLGRELAVGGYLALIAAAYLGGDLVYHEQIGVDHSSGQPMPEKFTRVLSAEDLAEGTLKRVRFHQTPILLVRRGSRMFALAETCAHLGGPLSEGKLRGKTVTCPWHGSRFDLESGAVLEGPSAFPQPCLEARIRQGQIEIRTAVRPAN